MSKLFARVGGGEEKVIVDSAPLDVDYQPPIIQYRENEQKYIAECIKPLFSGRSGKNLYVTGSPGIGKTAAARHVLNELKNETDDIHAVYVNCWKKDTSYKVALEICNQIDFKFVHNRDTSELLDEIAKVVNKKGAVVVLDECDKLQDDTIFYMLAEDLYKKSIIMITNDEGWIARMDNRLRSRIIPEKLNFRQYSRDEIEGILRNRIEYAFAPGTISSDAIKMAADSTYDEGDIRLGLALLRECGEIAESRDLKNISAGIVDEAYDKVKGMSIKNTKTLDETEGVILNIIKENNGTGIMKVYNIYKSNGGDQSYSNFAKKVKRLGKGNYITLKEVSEGSNGRTTLLYFGHNEELDKFIE